MRRPIPSRLRTPAMFAVTLATGAALTVAQSPAAAEHDVTPARVAGATRADTAANVAALAYPDGTDVAFVARDDDFADALASAALAGLEDAPLLLTDSDELTDRTAEALTDLGVEYVTILGGEVAVSAEVEAELEQDHTVARIAGENRYDTANRILTAVQRNNDNRANFPAGQRAFFVANAERFPDALAAGAPAAARAIPTALVPRDEVPAATADTVQELDMDLAIIVGGPAAVSTEVEQAFADMGMDTARVEGATRTETATELARFAVEYLDFTLTRPLLARGDHFADALAAGPLGGVQAAPILLTDTPDDLSAPTRDWLELSCPDVEVVRAVGGEAAVTATVLDEAVQAAEGCEHGERGDASQDFLVSPQEVVEVAPGTEYEFSVVSRYDEQELTGPLHVALFPCGEVDSPSTGGDPQFHDTDDDGRADGIEETDTGAAVITGATGSDDPGEKSKRGAVTGDDGRIHAQVRADAQDCAVVVFFDDENDDSALNVGTFDDPLEPYGLGRIVWR